jgi:hypothetical protein
VGWVLLQWSDAAVDCTSALAIDAGYVKAYMRRASAYEQSDDLERALADYKKVRSSRRRVETEPGTAQLLMLSAYTPAGTAQPHP